LILEKGADVDRIWTTDADWLEGTLSGRLTVSGNTLRLNTETWDIADDMDNFRAQGWQTSGDSIISRSEERRVGKSVEGGRRHTRFSRDWSSDVCSSDLSYWKRAPT